MNPEMVVDLLRTTLGLAVLLTGPILGAGMVVGLVVAVIQAATQIQDSSLTFVPKVLAIGGALAIGAPWAIEKLVSFAVQTFTHVAVMAPGAV